jgi:iron complex outermembrane receptor protein
LANGLHGRTYGIEVEATYQASDRWRLNAGYTFLTLSLEQATWSTDTAGERLEGDSPRHQSFVRSSLALPHQLALDVTARYVGNLSNQEVPAYVTADARLGWQVTAGLQLDILGQNLLDPQHPEFGTPASRREVRRALQGRVTWRP